MKFLDKEESEEVREVDEDSDVLAKIITSVLADENTTPCLLALLKVEFSIVAQLLRDAPEHVVAWNEMRDQAYKENFGIDLRH
jgi:hypothetical protein